MREYRYKLWVKEEKCFALDNARYKISLKGQIYAPGSSLNITDRFVICQFTGRKDSEGGDIYDGYVLRCQGYNGYDKKEVVSWSDVYCAWILGDSQLSVALACLTHTEIIGNRYKSPDLLKGTDNG